MQATTTPVSTAAATRVLVAPVPTTQVPVTTTVSRSRRPLAALSVEVVLGPQGRLRAVSHTACLEGAGEMRRHRARADGEAAGNLLVRETLGHKPQDFF